MKKIALFAVAALIGTASFAAPKVVKHTNKKATVKTEAPATKAEATAPVAKAVKAQKATKTTATPKVKATPVVKAPKSTQAADTTAKAKKVHKAKEVKKTTTTAVPKA